MLRIIPLKDEKILGELVQQSGQDAMFAYCLYSRDFMEAYILYDIVDDCCVIRFIMANDAAYADGLVRAVLASCMDINIDTAVISDNVDIDRLVKHGILPAGTRTVDSIEKLFSSGCGKNGCAGCAGAATCQMARA